ncbi:hypothetical protein BZB76_2532 [Actinomadura pelletieri DSM 43383]|uniref:Tetratricopeptide repeat protein n=1 Tax=Actinomadura pelletieri DSM 43383 TaxID=1120940 RepID=A0A495QUM9_9ACTN|nr:hypothetical protein [Actinomadura pelletieri]RKS77157.1 hypothetical protein BZB76_2532 [Actinomadura pelletieri DSM 43383]
MTVRDDEAVLAARYETLMHRAEAAGDVSGLETLQADAERELGPTHRIVFLVECGIEDIRSQTRPVLHSVQVWNRLSERAAAVLSPDDPTLMTIEGFKARHGRRRGRPEDLDAGVEAYRRNWLRRREGLGEDHYRTRTMHANLAVALRERDGEGDLDEALGILREEIAHRTERYGELHPFTWIARLVMAQTLVRAAEKAVRPDERHRYAWEAARVAELLIGRRRFRFGVADLSTLRAHLVHAHALLMLGRADEAIPEIRHVRARAMLTRVPLEPGWPEWLLARAHTAAGEVAEALRWAERSHLQRAAYFPRGGRKGAETRRLLAELKEAAPDSTS